MYTYILMYVYLVGFGCGRERILEGRGHIVRGNVEGARYRIKNLN